MELWKIVFIVSVISIVLVETHITVFNFGLRDGAESRVNMGSVSSCWDGCGYYDRLMMASQTANDSFMVVFTEGGLLSSWAKECMDRCWIEITSREIPMGD